MSHLKQVQEVKRSEGVGGEKMKVLWGVRFEDAADGLQSPLVPAQQVRNGRRRRKRRGGGGGGGPGWVDG